jgi:hypothetical protein
VVHQAKNQRDYYATPPQTHQHSRNTLNNNMTNKELLFFRD